VPAVDLAERLPELVERQIEAYAATQALLMRAMFESSRAGNVKRDAWCAEHHG